MSALPVIRTCRATGTRIELHRTMTPPEWLDDGTDPLYPELKPVRWATVCRDHGTVCNHDTRKRAEAHMAWPEWCEECQPLLKGR